MTADATDAASVPSPTPTEYALALGLLALLAVGAGVATHRPGFVAVACVGVMVLALIPGALFRAKGYEFLEGWAAGLVVWPLAVAFGIFGPRQGGTAQRL